MQGGEVDLGDPVVGRVGAGGGFLMVWRPPLEEAAKVDGGDRSLVADVEAAKADRGGVAVGVGDVGGVGGVGGAGGDGRRGGRRAGGLGLGACMESGLGLVSKQQPAPIMQAAPPGKGSSPPPGASVGAGAGAVAVSRQAFLLCLLRQAFLSPRLTQVWHSPQRYAIRLRPAGK